MVKRTTTFGLNTFARNRTPLALCGAFLALLVLVYLSVTLCTGSEAKTAQECLSGAVWCSGLCGVILIAKVVWNGRAPR